MDVNQRAQFGKEKRLCFSCFESADHQSRDCSRKKRCDVEGCNKYHHTLIHGAAPVFVAPPPLNSAPPVSTLNAAAPIFVGASSVNCAPSAVLLQIVPIAVATSSGVEVNTFALLDSGSQTSLILEKFADAIGLVGEDSPLLLLLLTLLLLLLTLLVNQYVQEKCHSTLVPLKDQKQVSR